MTYVIVNLQETRAQKITSFKNHTLFNSLLYLGLWDVLEGLKWVNKNIEAFGGDPKRITIAGESEGAANVGYLSISPLAKGLYARQIMESTSPVNRISDNNTQNLAFSQQLVMYVGCANDSYTIDAHPKDVVQCLQGITINLFKFICIYVFFFYWV